VSTPDILRLYDLAVSDSSKVPRVTYRTNGQATYTCQPYSAAAEVTPQEAKDADVALRHEMRQTKQALISLGIQLESLAVNSTLRSGSVLTANETLAAGERWDNFSSASSTPIEDMQAALDNIEINVGISRANVNPDSTGRFKVIMSNYAATALRQHPNVLNRLTYSPSGTGAILTQKILADLLGIGEKDIHITANKYTSSQQGATAAYKTFMGSDVVLAYVDSDAENDQALGHEFRFDGIGGDAGSYMVRKYRLEDEGYAGKDVISVSAVVDYKVTNASAGFLFKEVLDVADTERYTAVTLD
jgi:hypothetical protein